MLNVNVKIYSMIIVKKKLLLIIILFIIIFVHWLYKLLKKIFFKKKKKVLTGLLRRSTNDLNGWLPRLLINCSVIFINKNYIIFNIFLILLS